MIGGCSVCSLFSRFCFTLSICISLSQTVWTSKRARYTHTYPRSRMIFLDIPFGETSCSQQPANTLLQKKFPHNSCLSTGICMSSLPRSQHFFSWNIDPNRMPCVHSAKPYAVSDSSLLEKHGRSKKTQP